MGIEIMPYGFTTELDLPDVRFREAREKPFDIYGACATEEDGLYRRVPSAVAKATSKAVAGHATATTGIRVRFCTDSTYVAIHAVMPAMSFMYQTARIASAGFDLYEKEGDRYYFYNSFRPGTGAGKGYENVIRFPTRRLRQLMIHFPLYSKVEKLYIGLEKDAVVDHGAKYRYDKPVVIYGSSIVHGGCASRPGNTYPALLSRDWDCDFINLGFAGAAKGEDAIRNYIASLDMSVFVLDYDHNAPNADHLRATYGPIYRAVRAAHPNLPIIMVTAPISQGYYHNNSPRHNNNRAAIYETYAIARAEGDANVRFIDGDSLFQGRHHDQYTVDGTHPTDAGFILMAEKIGLAVGAFLK